MTHTKKSPVFTFAGWFIEILAWGGILSSTIQLLGQMINIQSIWILPFPKMFFITSILGGILGIRAGRYIRVYEVVSE